MPSNGGKAADESFSYRKKKFFITFTGLFGQLNFSKVNLSTGGNSAISNVN